MNWLEQTNDYLFKDLKDVAYKFYIKRLNITVQIACDYAIDNNWDYTILPKLFDDKNKAKNALYDYVMNPKGPYNTELWRMKRRKFHKSEYRIPLISLKAELERQIDFDDLSVEDKAELINQLKLINDELQSQIEYFGSGKSQNH